VKNEVTKHIARHLQGVYFGKNWTERNLKDLLEDVTLKEATTSIHDLNNILTLFYHIHYFIPVVSRVLEGKPLSGNDKVSFDHPPVNSNEEWEELKAYYWKEAQHLIDLISDLPDKTLWDIFGQEKYGNYFSNLIGIIEHTHYHLGQIALVKKLIRQGYS
jgi:uncharacterized damage-inducible protein DinB